MTENSPLVHKSRIAPLKRKKFARNFDTIKKCRKESTVSEPHHNGANGPSDSRCASGDNNNK